MASKGEDTRAAILSIAMEQAAVVGLDGLSIAGLAEAASLSKSGLFAHFGSKESLQIEVIRAAADRFVHVVVQPALRAPRGVPRLLALVERWMGWGARSGGCLFVSASAELDDRPGPARDALVQTQRDWLDTLAGAVRIAIAEGHLAADVDPVQAAFELHALTLGYHHARRFLRDPSAEARMRAAVAALFARHVTPLGATFLTPR